MSERQPNPQNIAASVTEISERATQLLREEVELAKAEMVEKWTKLAKGAFVGVVAGVFFATAVLFVLIGCAWLLYYYLPGNDFSALFEALHGDPASYLRADPNVPWSETIAVQDAARGAGVERVFRVLPDK